jgi:hypothetical protein
LIASASKRNEGQRFWLRATMPSNTSCTVARTLGVWLVAPTISTSAFGSSDPAVRIPRGRWYLKLRPTSLTPLANSAEASVSPLNPP